MVSQLPRYQRFVDGLVLPATVADEPALDFCNTRAGWGAPQPREYLTSYDHLLVWSREAGLIAAAAVPELRRSGKREPAQAARALERALALRDGLYTACTDSSSAGWDTVAAEARHASAAAVLVQDAPPGRRWVIPESAGLDLPALEVARAAGALLDSTDLEIVGRCPGEGCGWLFLDARRRRRWCTMAVCGNRAKARRHAARAQQEDPA
ncbi:MAG TPA: CGNR zinc finger domain-containing protein [Gaiellaceae bacterium]|nr:CGNR zinc finger domain-containing protein [Gaiellaceae bacterium]